jgi:CubicO group peptidase (beta-lactamase class C family)
VNRTPSQGYRYSGGGTTVMQQLLMDVSNRPFPDLLRDTVFAPLEMASSTYQQPLPVDLHAIAPTGYRRSGKAVAGRWYVGPEMAAAWLWTTPSDLARYVFEVQLAYEGKSAKGVSREMIKQMLTKQGDGVDSPLGLGPFLHELGNWRYFKHDGSHDGFVCQFVGYWDRGQGAVIMTNSDVSGPLVREVMGAVAQVYQWQNWPARKLPNK